MSGVATQALIEAAAIVTTNVEGCVLGGIVAPQNSTWGFHWARNDLPVDHYSVTPPRNDQGNGADSSAIDFSFADSAKLQARTKRLQKLIQAGDPRILNVICECAGTLDGKNIWSWTAWNGEQFNVYDTSHFGHNHCAGWRDMSEDIAAWKAFANAYAGIGQDPEGGGTPIGDDELTPEDRKWIQAQFNAQNTWINQKLTQQNNWLKKLLNDLKENLYGKLYYGDLDSTGKPVPPDKNTHVGLRDIMNAIRGKQ